MWDFFPNKKKKKIIKAYTAIFLVALKVNYERERMYQTHYYGKLKILIDVMNILVRVNVVIERNDKTDVRSAHFSAMSFHFRNAADIVHRIRCQLNFLL